MCHKINEENPHCVVYLGEFNAHSSEWWIGDDTDYEGRELLHYFSTNQLHQLVNEPTYFVGDNRSCIDLVLTDQPNLTNCHHQISQVSLNIRSPPHSHIWHYDRAQVEPIKRAISNYDWVTELNLRNTDTNLLVEHLTEGLNNIHINFIPHDDVTIKP